MLQLSLEQKVSRRRCQIITAGPSTIRTSLHFPTSRLLLRLILIHRLQFLPQQCFLLLGTRLRFVLALLVSIVAMAAQLSSRDLAPRAYVITPVHSNAVTITWGFYTGGVDFNGIVPIGKARGTYYVPIFSYYHSLNFFGRSANFTGALPYAVGNFQGAVSGQSRSIYRSGLLDSTFRFSVNLLGGPAMQPKEMVKWKQKRLLGVSLKVVAPTGQYSGTNLINWGGNRWVFKPEFGYSERWGHWVISRRTTSCKRKMNRPPFQVNNSRSLPSRRKSRKSCSVVRKLPT
jgi:hypothetical protein